MPPVTPLRAAERQRRLAWPNADAERRQAAGMARGRNQRLTGRGAVVVSCRAMQSTTVVQAPHTQPPAVLPNANDPCWCGSGRKYKRCHRSTEGRVLQGIVSPMRPVPTTHRPTAVRRDRRGPRSRRAADQVARDDRADACHRQAGRRDPPPRRRKVAPGVTTEEIDAYVHQLYIERDCYPSPLNYNGYPKSVCTSVNEVICHGIPDSRALQDGDIVNLDVTAYFGGVHGDTNATFFVGDVDPQSQQLVRVTEEAMWLGIEAVKPGRRLERHRQGDRDARQEVPLWRDPRLRRPRDRRAVPRRHPGPALLRHRATR